MPTKFPNETTALRNKMNGLGRLFFYIEEKKEIKEEEREPERNAFSTIWL
jgi:hypothetical protein